VANKIEDRLVSEWASDEKRTLLDLATGGRIKHTGVGKYKGQSGGAPEIKEKVIPGIEFLTGAYRGEEPSIASLAMAAPISGKALRAAMPAFKTAAKTTKEVYSRWYKAASIAKISDKVILKIAQVAQSMPHDMEGFIRLLRGNKEAKQVLGKGLGITKVYAGGKGVSQASRQGMKRPIKGRVVDSPERIKRSRKEAVKRGEKLRKSSGVREY
jgi:hypothetical protein